MKQVYLEYNPFLMETTIEIDGEPISIEGELYKQSNGRRMQEWLDELFPELVTECNDDITLTFRGTQLDFDDVRVAKESYERQMQQKGEEPIGIRLEALPFAKSAQERIAKLKELFGDMQRDCPFPDLQDEDIKRSFQDAIDTEFEVNVIATMSSGKSTLINALLGRELMPSKNEACTATIARITDRDEKDVFSAECRNENGDIIEKNDNLTLEAMERYNNDTNIMDIDIEGNIPFVSSQDMQLVLLDTPGPNNSRTDEHEKRTYRVIKDDRMPMALYVMNATQLFVDDDDTLLRAVAEAMQAQHGKQARDRFIFAINKTDMLDPEKGESVSNMIAQAEDYLKKKGIETPNIYPVSAETAKLIRMNKNGAELTKKQRWNLEGSVENFENAAMHLETYAPLSMLNGNKMKADIDSARSNQDKYAETLVHTGVPAVEATIAEYVEKYALTSKIKMAVDTFKSGIEEKQLTVKLEDEMASDEEKRKILHKQYTHLEKQFADGKEAQKFREKIHALDVSSDMDKKCKTIRAKISKVLEDGKQTIMSSNATMAAMADVAERAQWMIPKLERDVQTDLEKVINDIVIESAKKTLDDYKKHIQSLLETGDVQTGDFGFQSTLQLMKATLPNLDGLLRKYSWTEMYEEKVGEREVSDSTWYKPWTWFSSHMEDIKETRTRTMVDGAKLMEEIFDPAYESFNQNINAAKKEAKEQTEKFKTYFLEEIKKLDSAMQKKAKEMKEVSSDSELLQQKIKENEQRKVWLARFQEKLDEVLNV